MLLLDSAISDEVGQARLAGFNHLTITLAVLEQMLDHPLSSQTAQDFKQDGVGITPLNSNLI